MMDSQQCCGGRPKRVRGLSIFLMLVFAATNGVAAQDRKQEIHLYFIDIQKPFLTAETRVVAASDDPVAFGRQIVDELIHGPSGGGVATLPAGTALRAFFVLADGTAVVDFSESLRNRHPGGCRSEQLTLFSVVNSLILNVAGIDRVRVLIGGEAVDSLAGHLPLHFALTADMRLIR
jgi:spore germination protein GerM